MGSKDLGSQLRTGGLMGVEFTTEATCARLRGDERSQLLHTLPKQAKTWRLA